MSKSTKYGPFAHYRIDLPLDDEDRAEGITSRHTDLSGLLDARKPGYIYRLTGFNEFETTSTKIPDNAQRKTPSKEHIRLVYYDPSRKRLTPSTPIVKRALAQYQDKEHRIWFTLDNGDRPFMVVHLTNEKTVLVQKQPDAESGYYLSREDKYDDEKDWTYPITVKEYRNVEHVWVGKSPVTKMTTFSGGHGKEFDGNTILLHLDADSGRYAYVGGCVWPLRIYGGHQ